MARQSGMAGVNCTEVDAGNDPGRPPPDDRGTPFAMAPADDKSKTRRVNTLGGTDNATICRKA